MREPSTRSPLVVVCICLSPSGGVSTWRVFLRRSFPCSELGMVALNPWSRLTSGAAASDDGILAESNSGVASTPSKSLEVSRRPASDSLLRARPRVAKSTTLDVLACFPWPEGREEDNAAALTTLVVMSTGATDGYWSGANSRANSSAHSQTASWSTCMG